MTCTEGSARWFVLFLQPPADVDGEVGCRRVKRAGLFLTGIFGRMGSNQ